MLTEPLFRDLHTLSRMFPTRDQNEIYAYLDAHHNFPNRVALVTDELLRTMPLNDTSFEPTYNALQFLTGTGTPEGRDDGMWMEGRGRAKLESLFKMFPDCDPDHIVVRLHALAERSDYFQLLATELAENKYPLLRDRIVAEQVIVPANVLLLAFFHLLKI